MEKATAEPLRAKHGHSGGVSGAVAQAAAPSVTDNLADIVASFHRFLERYSGKGGKLGKKFAIATHRRADVDGLSSAFAISRQLPGSIICTSEDMDEAAKSLASRLGVTIYPLATVNKADFEGLIVVDTSAYTLLSEAKGWKILLIIDHHRADGRDMKAEFELIDSGSPSTAEIIANMLAANKLKIDHEVAFALSAAIISDGARFKSARTQTFQTLGWLMANANLNYPELLSYAEPEPKDEVKIALMKAMQRLQFVYGGGYLIATSEVNSNESDAASLICEAADVAFVAKWKLEDKETRVSARARKNVAVPLNEVMAEVGRCNGGMGGGHAKAAGASLRVHTSEALKSCVEIFTQKSELSRARK